MCVYLLLLVYMINYYYEYIGFQDASIRTQTSLSFLNFGQNAIFSGGLMAMMYMACVGVMNGTASLGK